LLVRNKFYRHHNYCNHDDQKDRQKDPIGGAALFKPNLALSTPEKALEKKECETNQVETLLAPLAVALLLMDYLVQLCNFCVLLRISSG